MLHSISGIIRRTEFLQTFRNTKQIPLFTVCATGTNTPKLPRSTLLSISALQIQIYWWHLFSNYHSDYRYFNIGLRGFSYRPRIQAAGVQGRVSVYLTGEAQHQRIREE
jgi:hypothetical protein